MRGSPFSRPASIASASCVNAADLAPHPTSSATVFGPMPGSFSSSRTPAPYFASNSSRSGSVARCGNRLQVRRHALADPVDLEQPRRIGRRLHQIHRRLLGGLGRAAVAADAEAVARRRSPSGRLSLPAAAPSSCCPLSCCALPGRSCMWPSASMSPSQQPLCTQYRSSVAVQVNLPGQLPRQILEAPCSTLHTGRETLLSESGDFSVVWNWSFWICDYRVICRRKPPLPPGGGLAGTPGTCP